MVLVNFLRRRDKSIQTYHCTQSSISDIVEFTIDIADLVTNLPGRTEKRDYFTVGVLKLQGNKFTRNLTDLRQPELTTTSTVVVLGRHLY